MWIDESGCDLPPAAVRTSAPRGQPPGLPAPLPRDHRSLISGISSAGRLLVQAQEEPFRGPTVVGFLRHLLRHLPSKLLVLWDGAPLHRAQPLKDCLATEQGQRVQFERLPGYAPAVNPAEGSWQHVKRLVLCYS